MKSEVLDQHLKLSFSRVSMPPGKSWKVLDFYFKNFQVLESPGK